MEFINEIIFDLGEGLRGLMNDTASFPLVLLFFAIMFGVLAVPRMVGTRAPVQRRLGPVGRPRNPTAEVGLRESQTTSLWNQVLSGLEKRAVPAASEKARTSVRQRLSQAGYMRPEAVRTYFVLRLALAVGLPMTFLILAPLFSANIPAENVLITGVTLTLIGLYMPAAWVTLRIHDRRRAIQESFPDALDMLMVCVEAGLGLDAAFSRVGEQMALAHPILSQHFGLISLELRAGKSREAAMRNMSDRIGLDEVTSFVVLLIQSDQLGSSHVFFRPCSWRFCRPPSYGSFANSFQS
jgi:tight adherence protein C